MPENRESRSWVSTHYMDEANHCDRLGLMDQGRLIAADSPLALKRQSEQRSGRLMAIYGTPLRIAFDAVKNTFPRLPLCLATPFT